MHKALGGVTVIPKASGFVLKTGHENQFSILEHTIQTDIWYQLHSKQAELAYRILVAVTGVTVAELPVGFVAGVPNFVIVGPNMANTWLVQSHSFLFLTSSTVYIILIMGDARIFF
jgi:hypothetical protein